MEEKINSTNVQVAQVTAEGGYKLLPESQIAEMITALV